MKHIPLYEDFKNLNEKVTVDTSRYERSHGKKPRGRGGWAFYFDRTGGEAIFTPQSMEYADAVKWAKEQAKEAGKTVVYVGESVNEAAGKEAMGIAEFTGTRGDAVQKFIDDNKLDAKKLFNYVKGGKLTDRSNFVTAVVGTPGNPEQKRMIKMFGESVNEANYKVGDTITVTLKGGKVIKGKVEKLNPLRVRTGPSDVQVLANHFIQNIVKESVNEGVRISLFDPNKNKILKSLSLDRNYREAEKEVETLNKRLSASEKNKGYYWKVTTIGESVNEEYDVSGLSRQDLNKILSHLDSNDISYDFDGRNEILEFDPTELDKKSQEDFIKMGLPINESRRSIIHPVIMQQRYLHAKGKKLVLPNISDIDHTRIVKWMGGEYYSNQYDIMMKGKDLEIVFKKMSSQEIERLKYYLKSQNYLKESNNIDVAQLKVGRILHFKDGEEWKVTKIIGNPSNPRGVLALPHGDTKKGYVSVAIEFTIDDLENTLSNIFPGK